MNLNKCQKGLTLIEVVASIVILSIVLILAISIFSQMVKTNSNSKENLETASIGKEILVEMKKIKFTSIHNKPISEINKTFPIKVTSIEANTIQNIEYLSLIGTYQYFNNDYGITIHISKEIEENTKNYRRMKINIKNSRNNISSTIHGYLTN